MLLTTIRTARQRAENRAVRRAAFTLLEVLIVVAILVILASAASIALFRYLEDAKVGRAKTGNSSRYDSRSRCTDAILWARPRPVRSPPSGEQRVDQPCGASG